MAAAATAANAQRIYTHSASEEKTTGEVRAGLDAAKAAHLQAIDAHRTYLVEALARERTLVAEREIASRDARIAEIIEAMDPSDSPREELEQDIMGRLSAISGVQGDALRQLTGQTGYTLLRKAGDMQRNRAAFIADEALLSNAIREFQAAGGRGTYCTSSGTPAPVVQAPGTNEAAFDVIRVMCRSLERRQRDQAEIVAGAPPEALSIIGHSVSPENLRAGEIKDALIQSQQLTQLLRDQAALSNAAKNHLKQLEDYYRCQQSRASEPGMAARIQQTAQEIQEFTDWLENLTPEAFRRQLNQQMSSGDGDANAVCTPAPAPGDDAANASPIEKPERIDGAADLLSSAGITPQQFEGVLNNVTELDPVRSILAAVQEQVQEFRSDRLMELLTLLSSGSVEADESPRAQVAASLFRMVRNIENIRSARGGALPDTSGVLIRIASSRMQVATARIEAARLQELKRLSDLRLAALRRETLDLLAAYRLLITGGDRAIERSLLRYADSWSNGRMPGRVIAYDMDRAEYLAWADRERAAIEAAYAVLEPAVAELQIYGAGGIRASEIARYLNVIGVGALAIGDTQ